MSTQSHFGNKIEIITHDRSIENQKPKQVFAQDYQNYDQTILDDDEQDSPFRIRDRYQREQMCHT